MDVKLITDIEPLLAKLIPISDEVFIASAYINKGAVQSLMQRATAQGKHKLMGIRILCGLDVMTNPDALHLLQEAMAADEELIQVRCVPHRPGFLFHPKVYFFKSGSTSHLIVGSGNLTTAGQFKNQELYCYIQCESNNEIARQFQKIGDQWFQEEFSTPLTPEIADVVSTHEKHLQQFLSGERSVAKARRELAEDAVAMARLCVGIMPDPIIVPPPPDPKPWVTALRRLIEAGYVIDVGVSLKQLRVPIPMELIGRAGVGGGDGEGKAIVVVSSSTAYVKLLPPDAMSAFESFRRDAESDLRYLCLELDAGWYVPPRAQPAVRKLVQQLKGRHRKLLTQYIKRPGPIREHLSENLKADLEAAWATRTLDTATTTDADIFKQVTASIKERREQLRKNSEDAIPLNVSPAPHPTITMLSFPDHPAWNLQERDPDEELISAVLDVLLKQMDIVTESASYRNLPTRKKHYERARLLVCIEGKTTRLLMRRLSRSLKPPEKAGKSASQKIQKKAPGLEEEMEKIRIEAKKHQEWLKGLESKPGEEVLTQLKSEYDF